MSDFFAPPPGYPEVPPEPATPPPDFSGIGHDFTYGVAAASGALGGAAKFGDWILQLVAKILGFLLSMLVRVFAYVIGIIGDVSNEASASYGVIVAATLKELFGVEVDPASVSTRRGGADRQAVANKLGQTVVGTFFSGVKANPAGGIVPSDAAANNFLGVVMNMELNGWIESWFADGITGHVLEKYGDLKDGIARVLGLGRMSRQVFAPPLKVLVHDPYLELLYQKYRSKAPGVTTVMNAFFRGEIDTTKLSELLGNQGYTEQEILWITADHEKPVPLADIDYLLSRGTWTDADAQQVLQAQGYTLANAQHAVAILNDKRTFKYRQEMVSVAQAAYLRGDMDLTTFQQVVSTLNLTAEETQWISSVATFKRATTITHLSLGQIETGIKEGVLSFNDLQAWAARVNMPADELAFLELSLQVQMNKAAVSNQAKAAAAGAKATAAKAKSDAAAAKATAAKATAVDKGISVAEAETLVTDGFWTFDQLATFLTGKGYGTDAIAAIVHLLHDKLNAAAAKAGTAATVRGAAAAKGLSMAEAEKAVIAGILTTDDLAALLTAHGYDPADVQVVVELTAMAAADAQTKAAAKAAATTKAASKSISLAELERAVRAGLTTLDAYNAALTKAGFDAMSITLLDGLLQDQIAADKAAAAKQSTPGTAATSKGITLAQLEQEVINGLRPIADYTAELRTLNYSLQDAADLTSLLQLHVDQAKTTAVHRAAAEAKLSARDISITEAERAVKLGVIPLATYQKLLAADGFTPTAVDVLSGSLLAEVAKTSKAQQTANGAATVLARKQISLPDLERAVIAGITPIATYAATLSDAGYSAADVETLTQLLQLKTDQAEQVRITHSDAEGNATQKGISLGSEEAAVISGDKSMADYDALLTNLGYDLIDRATLEGLLQTRVTAKAAKDGTTPPAAVVG